MRIKEQETRLTLQEHDDYDEVKNGGPRVAQELRHVCSIWCSYRENREALQLSVLDIPLVEFDCTALF